MINSALREAKVPGKGGTNDERFVTVTISLGVENVSSGLTFSHYALLHIPALLFTLQ